jgi:hypothetical protein
MTEAGLRDAYAKADNWLALNPPKTIVSLVDRLLVRSLQSENETALRDALCLLTTVDEMLEILAREANNGNLRRHLVSAFILLWVLERNQHDRGRSLRALLNTWLESNPISDRDWFEPSFSVLCYFGHLLGLTEQRDMYVRPSRFPRTGDRRLWQFISDIHVVYFSTNYGLSDGGTESLTPTLQLIRKGLEWPTLAADATSVACALYAELVVKPRAHFSCQVLGGQLLSLQRQDGKFFTKWDSQHAAGMATLALSRLIDLMET